MRTVPTIPALGKLLKAHQKLTKRSGDDLVFGRTATEPFTPSTPRARALKAWGWSQRQKDGKTELVKDRPDALDPITLHQCRHTAASLMIAAGANAKALSVVMGHASIEITFNRYGHLMPGGEVEVGDRLAAFPAAA